MASHLEQLAKWIDEARRRNAWQVLLVPDEPPIYRSHLRAGQAEIDRSAGDVLVAGELAALAEEILGREPLDQLGRQVGAIDARVRLPDGTSASITAARTGGQVTLVARPIKVLHLDCATIRVPESIVRAAESPGGLLIVTGLPGCGKTTTCYALLEHLNATRPLHIVEAVYHAEFMLEPKRALIQQRQIGVDAPDMLAGMQSAMLQGADVLFVGEIRDLEVFQACVRMAEFGCLVITQLHQPTPQAAIERMVNLQPEPLRPAVRKSLAQVLRGVLAQVLLPTPEGRQVPAYGAFVPDAESRQCILQGGEGLDVFCRPRLEEDIQRLLDEGRADPAAAKQALQNLAGASTVG